MQIMNTQPVLLQGNHTGCLLIHGFGGTPTDLGQLPEYLAAQGYTVLTVQLAGHGTTPAAFYASRWEEWLASVEAGYQQLRQHCQQIVVVGFSLGGVLGLLLSQRQPIAGIVTMGSRVITLDNWYLAYAPVRALFALRDPSIAAFYQLRMVVQQAAAILPLVQVPALVMQGRDDTVVTLADAEAIANGIRSAKKDLVWWDATGHEMLVAGPHRDAIYQRIAGFVGHIHQAG